MKNSQTTFPIQLRTIQQLHDYTESQPAQRFVIDDFLPVGSALLISGESGLGKSMVCCSIALAVASGSDIFGWEIPQPSKVIYLDGELNANESYQRLLEIQNGNKLSFDDSNFIIATVEGLFTEDFEINLNDSTFIKILIEYLKSISGKVLVIDPIYVLFPSKYSENDDLFWSGIHTLVRECTINDITLIMVHHNPKTSPNKPSGSSSNVRSFTAVLSLTKTQDDNSGKLKLKFNASKNRYGGKRFKSDCWELVDTPEGLQWVGSISNSKVVELIAPWAKEAYELRQANLSLNEIAKILNQNKNKVYREVNKYTERAVRSVPDPSTSDERTVDEKNSELE